MRSQEKLEEWCSSELMFEPEINSEDDTGLHECILRYQKTSNEKYKVGDNWARASVARREGRRFKYVSKEYERYHTDGSKLYIEGPDSSASIK